MQNTCALILPGYCSFQNILKNPIISQIEAFSYIFFYYSSTITINSTTATPNCTLQSVLFTSRGYTRLGITSLKSVKLNGKKKIEIVCSFNGIPITYRLEMDFLLHKSEIISVCHVYVTQSGLKQLFHETRDMSSARGNFLVQFSCLSFFAEISQTRTQGTNKQIVDLSILILDRIGKFLKTCVVS